MKLSAIAEYLGHDIVRAYMGLSSDVELDFGDLSIVTAAVDIGYGFTKICKGLNTKGKIALSKYPSLAPLSPSTDSIGVMNQFIAKRKTVKIKSDFTIYEVGQGVNEIKTNSTRALHSNFVGSDTWKLLLKSALLEIGQPEIDWLVLGLPVENMAKFADVEKEAKKTHEIEYEENGVFVVKTVVVKNVLVIPQPLGALYNHASKAKDFQRFMRTSTLVVDAGHLTYDFLVSKGFQYANDRSGSRAGGMSAILKAIAQSVSEKIGATYDDLTEIDIALQNDTDNRFIFVYGDEINLNDHLKATSSVIESNMNHMLNVVGDVKDVANIVVGGGPNNVFLKSVCKQFPTHYAKESIHVIPNGITANVEGFQIFGWLYAIDQMIKDSHS